MTRYFQRVGQPGRIEHVEDHWPASMAAMEADPAWREVTVSPVVSDDVIEEAVRLLRDEASRVDALLDAAWDDEVFDTSIMSSHVMDGVPQRIEAAPEVIVRALAARGLLVGEDPEPGMLHRRFDGGRGTVLDDTGRVVGYLAGPRTVTDEQRMASLRDALRSLVEAVEAVGEGRRYWPRDMRIDGTHRRVEDALDVALAALGFTVEGES